MKTRDNDRIIQILAEQQELQRSLIIELAKAGASARTLGLAVSALGTLEEAGMMMDDRRSQLCGEPIHYDRRGNIGMEAPRLENLIPGLTEEFSPAASDNREMIREIVEEAVEEAFARIDKLKEQLETIAHD